MPNKNKQFTNWIQQNVTVQEWKDFHKVLGVGSKKLSRLVNGTDPWTAEHIQRIAQYFKVHWYEDIVVPYGVGAQDITIDDMQNMGGVQVSPLPRPA